VIQSAYGVAAKDLELLVNVRLLRRDQRLGSDFYELSHDSLVLPLLAKRRRRQIRNAITWILMPCLIGAASIFWYTKNQFQALREFETDQKATQEQSSAKQSAIANLRLQLLHEGPMTPERLDVFASLINLNNTNFSGLNLRLLNIRDPLLHQAFISPIPGLDFSFSNLEGADFSQALIVHSNFQKSKLVASNFSNAKVSYAQFDGADLSQANFRGSDLKFAHLMNTNCTNMDLRGAELSKANVKDGIFNGARFDETEWWLAIGWSPAQFNELIVSYPPEQFAKGEEFRAVVGNYDSLDRYSKNSYIYGVMLNNVAWYRARALIQLDTALANATEAVSVLEPHDAGTIPYFQVLDTLGYVYLGLGRFDDAVPEFRRSLERGPRDSAYSEIAYHLSIALRQIGKTEEADSYERTAVQAGYEPSYERLLLWKLAEPSGRTRKKKLSGT
jgi:uncharacterized protein YjbI with pentapeptide repeats